MDGRPPIHNCDVTLLWKRGPMRCTGLVLAADHIEINMSIGGVVFSHQVFAEYDVAARYAIDQMHAYGSD